MNLETAVLRSTPLPIHCDCLQKNCNGEVVEFASGCAREIFIRCDPASAWPEDRTPRKQAQSFYECLPWILHRADARMADVILERVFFRDIQADFEALSQARKQAYALGNVREHELPVASYIGQPPCTPGQAFELQVYALVPELENTASVTTIPATAECPAARIVDIGGCRHCYATNIAGPGESFRAQSDAMFARVAQLLARHGVDFQNVFRTWYYLDDIKRDYSEFNKSRNDFFRQEKVRLFPASTGIGASLPRGKRCAMDVYALLDLPLAQVEVMHTSTLNEAPDYGSAFSRGMKVCLPEKTVLYISGTASVDESGATVHVGNARRQLERMLLNVQQLLAPHGADFTDMVQMITYLKSADDFPLYRDVAAKWGLTNLPNSVVQADVCRPNLLCEMEAIAMLPA